jgi:hypothetical protein
MSTTAELKASIAARASALRLRLNDPSVDPVAAGLEAKRLFEDSMDEIRQKKAQAIAANPGGRVAACVVRFLEPKATLWSD